MRWPPCAAHSKLDEGLVLCHFARGHDLCLELQAETQQCVAHVGRIPAEAVTAAFQRIVNQPGATPFEKPAVLVAQILPVERKDHRLADGIKGRVMRSMRAVCLVRGVWMLNRGSGLLLHLDMHIVEQGTLQFNMYVVPLKETP